MNKDILLKKFFETERWQYALDKGMIKGISKAQLYQLTKPEVRAAMYKALREDRYAIMPPHTAQIPKDDGTFRTVYINEPIDRVFLSIANDLLFEMMSDRVHPACQSYQKGIGCGQIVKEVSNRIKNTNGKVIGWKADLSKYFDSVPIEFIDKVFELIDIRFGESKITKVLRDYYHSDWYFDKGELKSQYQSLKQGCAVASWLANVLLYHIDDKLSELNGYYVRYSDDILFIGNDYEIAMEILQDELQLMNMKLNPKKVEYLSDSKWFKFLGYSIKGADISLSSTRLKTFQNEIESRTIKLKGATYKKALNSVNQYLYKGNGEFSWATQILPVCNVKKDLHELDHFVMDCLRAVVTKKIKIGGLGYRKEQSDGCIQRGIGKNVKANRTKTPQQLDGYMTISCMQNALRTSKEAYLTLVELL